ncbi:hypothetical protein OAO01_04550 [Oligoflexia bacterium]|nr:hypothetical protein [Oligoflexia bacterium]
MKSNSITAQTPARSQLFAVTALLFVICHLIPLSLHAELLPPNGASSAASDNTDKVSSASGASAQGEKKEEHGLLNADFDNLPTYIKSDSLILKSNARVFEYTGHVHVKQGDMVLTCDLLEGTYDENNQIKQLIAMRNVFITKGEDVRARSERAIYDAPSETITLTENPELQQKESVLTADLIRIFLREDRSTAEGAVRVKMIEDKEKEEKEKKAIKKKRASAPKK